MENFIEDSKYRNETVSVVVSFADVLSLGDSIIGVPIITINVAYGIDPSPSDLLYLGVSILPGNAVEQRFKLGVPGVIYTLLYTVRTALGDTLQKECYLAILPEVGNATPFDLILYETSSLYPLLQIESVSTSLLITGGRLTQTIIYPVEAITSNLSITSGNMVFYAQIYYTNPPESITTNLVITSGSMVYYAQIHYDNPPENIKTNIAIISGTFTAQNNISYNDSGEGITTSLAITFGVLT